MKLNKEYVIDGKIVHKETSFGDIEVYSLDTGGDMDAKLYFVSKKSGQVLQQLFIDTEMSQGIGYISMLQFSKGENDDK